MMLAVQKHWSHTGSETLHNKANNEKSVTGIGIYGVGGPHNICEVYVKYM